MYNYFIQTKKKIHKFPTTMQWMDGDLFVTFLKDVKSKDDSLFVKSWRSKARKDKRNGKK